MSSRLLLTVIASASLLAACGKEGDKPAPEASAGEAAKPPEQPRDPDASVDKVVTAVDITGPVPPEISATFFILDGALVPLGCFDKAKNKLAAGKDCLALTPPGAEVYLKSAHSAQVDVIGAPKRALCEIGDGEPTSLTSPLVDSGAVFDWATSPKSAAQKVLSVSPDTWGNAPSASDEERAAVQAAAAAVDKQVGANKAEVHQAASIDLDGDGKDERVFSAYVVNPRDTARYLFSGIFVARGSDPTKLLLVEQTRTNSEVFKLRAAADLNGDGVHELWINAAFDEGGGDRMYQWKGDKFEPLGKWTCGM
jgi:hypothetical protein